MDTLKSADTLLDSLENGHFVIDDDFIVTYWNRWLSINTQIPADDIVGKSLKEFYPDINYKILLRKIRTALRLNSPTFYDASRNTVFLPIRRNKVTKTSLPLMQQQVTISPYIISENRVMISVYDISELFEMKLSLQTEIEKVNELNEVLKEDRDIIDKNIMVMKTSTSGKMLDMSTLFCDFFEYKRDELIGKNVSMLKSGNIPKSIYQELWQTILDKKFWSGEFENMTSKGENKWVETRVSPMLDSNDELIGFTAVYHDIVNKKLLEELYITDTLTKIYNRAYFDDLMNSISKYQRKADTDFVILIADIDHFKSINDTYGHQVGDEALKSVATTLKDSLRNDDIVARWGGEEFVVMIKNVNIDEAQVVAEKLRSNIEKTKVQGRIDLTISFGLTQYYIGEDTNKTFKRADDALYEAKNTGRNKVVTRL